MLTFLSVHRNIRPRLSCLFHPRKIWPHPYHSDDDDDNVISNGKWVRLGSRARLSGLPGVEVGPKVRLTSREDRQPKRSLTQDPPSKNQGVCTYVLLWSIRRHQHLLELGSCLSSYQIQKENEAHVQQHGSTQPPNSLGYHYIGTSSRA